MIKRLLIAGTVMALLGSPLTVGAAPEKKPASFALWVAEWKGKTDQETGKVGDACVALYGKTADRKIGECFVKGLRVLLRREQPQWRRAVARISVGQTAACKKTIHAYWLASTKAQQASLIYLDSHPHTDITQVARDLKEVPYSTLKAASDAAKKRAVQVCG